MLSASIRGADLGKVAIFKAASQMRRRNVVFGVNFNRWIMPIVRKLCMTLSGAVIVLPPHNGAAQRLYEGCPRGTFF